MSEIKLASGASYPKRKAKPGRVDLIPEEFDNLVEDQGIRIRITPSAVCPNRTELEDTNHKLDCPLCFGSQVVDIKDECFEEWAFMQSIHIDKQFNVQGMFDIKDAKITFKQGTRVGYWFKIEVLDFASVFNEVLKRKSGDIDILRYPVGGCDTPFHLMDKTGKKYYINQDYRVDGRDLIWIGERPETGTLYTFVYPVLPTFRVIELLNENRYYYRSFKQKTKEPVNLPQQALLRLDYMADRNGRNQLLLEGES
jgi:hypothetical protein